VKIYLSNQNKFLKKHLNALKKESIAEYKQSNLRNKISKCIVKSDFHTLSFDKFFDYLIFPSNILNALPQWIEEGREIKPGDTIVQQINIPPFSQTSVRLIVGVRVLEVINSSSIKSFSYETLNGHVEKGIAIFKVELVDDLTIFSIESYSAPNAILLKLLYPLASLYQDYCTNKAILNAQTIFS
jgi:hypothetical protein